MRDGDLDYTIEKYAAAVSILAASDRDLRDRLCDAYVSQASHIVPMHPGSGPPMSDELTARILDLHERFRVDPDVVSAAVMNVHGGMAAAIQAMSDDQVHQVASELVSICFATFDERFELADLELRGHSTSNLETKDAGD